GRLNLVVSVSVGSRADDGKEAAYFTGRERGSTIRQHAILKSTSRLCSAMPDPEGHSIRIRVIDTAAADANQLFDDLRGKLSPKGDVVSESGRQRKIELFGEPLTPQQVVERICGDVRTGGLAAVLEYTAKLDRKELTPDAIR